MEYTISHAIARIIGELNLETARFPELKKEKFFWDNELKCWVNREPFKK